MTFPQNGSRAVSFQPPSVKRRPHLGRGEGGVKQPKLGLHQFSSCSVRGVAEDILAQDALFFLTLSIPLLFSLFTPRLLSPYGCPGKFR